MYNEPLIHNLLQTFFSSYSKLVAVTPDFSLPSFSSSFYFIYSHFVFSIGNVSFSVKFDISIGLTWIFPLRLVKLPDC